MFVLLFSGLLLSCKGGPEAAAPGTDARPESWLGATPNSWASVDVKGIRAEASLAPIVECASAPAPAVAAAPATKRSYLAASLDALPCKEHLREANTIDLWLKREPQEPHTALVVVRGISDAAAACIEKASPPKTVSPTVTEHVFFGARWPRVYVVGTGPSAVWLLPTGKAAERTHAALASGGAAAAVPSNTLPAGTLLRFGGSAELVELVLEERGAAGADLHGLSSFELAAQHPTGKSLSFSANARFATKKDADDMAPIFRQITDRLAKDGTSLPMMQAGNTLGVAGQIPATFLARRCAAP